MFNVQLLAGQKSRVETGPLKFGDDWCGLFIRGDSCLAMASALRNANSEDVVSAFYLKTLIKMLEEVAE